MSVPVELDALQAKTEEYRWAYFLTVGDDERPKIVAVSPAWEGDTMRLAVGGGSLRNAESRPWVTVVYPPLEPDGYSLIVDGRAIIDRSGDEPRINVAPSGAVLHRPAPEGSTGSATGCSHDCAPID